MHMIVSVAGIDIGHCMYMISVIGST